MRTQGIVVLAIAVTALVTACGIASVSQSPTAGATAASKTVANYIGKGLQTAQDDARANGFHNLTSHDATGRERLQILDRDWKVCYQTPAAGTIARTTSRLDFGVVQLEEPCPGADKGTASPSPIAEGKPMPNLVGQSLNMALSSVPLSTSITDKDISGHNRLVIIPSGWKVCSQDPKPGTVFRGQPVTFGVVKVGESCP